MIIHYWKSIHGNFGDDINSWMWRELYPEGWWEEDVTFVGVGTIIDDRIPIRRINVIFSSGTGYAQVPQGLLTQQNYDSWRIYGVRGKLTAKAMNISEELAIGDGAYLIPELISVTRKSERNVFIPHVSSAIAGSWQDVCRLAELDYVDPRWESRRVCKSIAEAKTVIAESMHGAIIADALRIPWIPVLISPLINRFKWHDWCSMLGVDYKPINLSPSSIGEWLRINLAKRSGKGSIVRENARIDEDFVYRKFASLNLTTMERENAGKLKKILDTSVLPIINNLSRYFPLNYFEQKTKLAAAKSLQEILKRKPLISSDGCIKALVRKLLMAFDRLKDDHQRGFRM